MDEVGLGRLLQDARKKAGLTQQELCQKAGLSYSTLAKIERGAIKAPSIFTIQSVADALGLTLNDLLGSLPKPDAAKVDNRKVSKSGIRFVYFDINGCLVRFYHRAFTRIAEDSGQSADVIETTFWHLNDSVCRGEMPMDEFNRALGERFELPGFDWTKYYLETIEPITEMHEVLEWASRYYAVGLLSNIMPGLIQAMLDRQLIPRVPYSAIIDSSAVRHIKPEPEMFTLATNNAINNYSINYSIKPEEILLVDDSRANIMAAEKQGWRVLWFDDYRPNESAARVRDALEF